MNNTYQNIENEFIERFLLADKNESGADLSAHIRDGLDIVSVNQKEDFEKSDILKEMQTLLSNKDDNVKITDYNQMRSYLDSNIEKLSFNGFSVGKDYYDDMDQDAQSNTSKSDEKKPLQNTNDLDVNDPNHPEHPDNPYNPNNPNSPLHQNNQNQGNGSPSILGSIGHGIKSVMNGSRNKRDEVLIKGKFEYLEDKAKNITDNIDFLKENQNSTTPKIQHEVKQAKNELKSDLGDFYDKLNTVNTIADKNEPNSVINKTIDRLMKNNNNFSAVKDKIEANKDEKFLKEMAETAQKVANSIKNFVLSLLGRRPEASSPSP